MTLAGNREAAAAIASAVGGRALNSYLITGPEGSGKELAADILAAGLVCRGSGARPCGVCPSCVKAAHGAHPDIIKLRREGKENFLVSQSRLLKADAYIYPNESDRKVYILPDAGVMEPPAQNALLKLLEEPPDYAVFILLCERPGQLLETVVSRCVGIRMLPVTRAEAEGVLRERFPERSGAEISAAAAGCGGIVGRAIDALTDPGEAARLAGEIAAALASGGELEIYTAFSALDGRDRASLRKALAALCGLLGEALLPGASGALPEKYSQARLAAACAFARDIYEKSELSLPGGSLTAAAAAGFYAALTA